MYSFGIISSQYKKSLRNKRIVELKGFGRQEFEIDNAAQHRCEGHRQLNEANTKLGTMIPENHNRPDYPAEFSPATSRQSLSRWRICCR